MIIKVRVKTGKKSNKLVITNDLIEAELKSKPVKGRANKELISLIASELGINKNCIRIIKGFTARNKFLEINMKA